MTGDFEDPRKTELRKRCADAVDAAGYTVDAEPVPIPYPADSDLRGAIRPDVRSLESDGTSSLYFVRVDGQKPLPGWLTNTVVASFSMPGTEVYAVTEDIGEPLKRTCEAVGCGLLRLTSSNELDLELEYVEPDHDAAVRAFSKEIKDLRRQMETKLNANLQALQDQFSASRKVTEGMSEEKRAQYLNNIEEVMVRWRAWGEELSAELDDLAGSVEPEKLESIRKRVQSGAA
jgi:hypothetical protein